MVFLEIVGAVVMVVPDLLLDMIRSSPVEE
jgi:hypothetical protein